MESNNGDRDQNNNVLLSTSPTDSNKKWRDHSPPTPSGSEGVGVVEGEKLLRRVNTKNKSYNNSKLISSKVITSSMPVLCSLLWLLCFSIGVCGGVTRGLSPTPTQIMFPEDYPEGDSLQNLDDAYIPSRQGRVLTSAKSDNENNTLNSTPPPLWPKSREASSSNTSNSSEENGSSRKAAPDVQDIIDGIVKLLGGKVHNGTPPNPNAYQRPLTSPNPYNLFNPTKPFFTKVPAQTPRPTRINNRGPGVLPGGQQQDPMNSFEAIPLEALSTEFNLNKNHFGPPFPISGNGGGMIQNNMGTGGGGVMEAPYKKGVPLPEMVVPQQGQQLHHQGGYVYQPQQNQGPYQNQRPGPYQQNPHQQPRPNMYHTSPQPQLIPPQNTRYNPFGFEHPGPHPSSPFPPTPNPNKPTTFLVPPRKPVMKFPTEDGGEDDEADDLRFTTPKVSHPPISPTLSSSLSPSDSVYPTLLLSTNKENGFVELVTQYEEISSSSVPTTQVTTTSTTTNAPIFYPNNSKAHETLSTTSTPTSSQSSRGTTTTSSTTAINPLSIHSLPTPPLRPGIVINEENHKISHPPPIQGVGSVEVVTADEGSLLQGTNGGQPGEVFDVTVTAQQSYGGGSTVQPFVVPAVLKDEVITHPQGTQQFVSIDGKRTYFNLHPNTAVGVTPSRPTQAVVTPTPLTTTSTTPPNKNIGVGSVGNPVPLLPQAPGKTLFNHNTPVRSSPVSTSLSITGGGGGGGDKGLISKTPPNIIRRPVGKRPPVPPVRIDTCIVGDDSTCNSDQFEVCRTENGVSSCVCRSGYARRRHRETCKAIVSLVLSIKLDKFGDKKLKYDPDYFNPNSETYQQIEWESIHALDASLGETALAQGYIGSKLDAIGFDGKHAVVNMTVLIQENNKMPPAQLKKELQKQMIQVLTRHRNNFGKGQLWVEGPISAVAAITDVNECEDGELNDCNSKAFCVNTFGSFECKCEPGYGDPFEQDKRRSGRRCDSCSGKQYCNGRGECLIEGGHRVCKCAGNYYGSQCDIDGEVLAVAIGASVSAVVIIGLTLLCLCLWSRKWKKEEQKAALMSRTLFGGMATQALSYLGGNAKTNPYQQHVSMEERLRWAQVAESNMTGNIYVQNDAMSLAPCALGPQLMDTPPMMSARRSAETVDTTVEEMFDDRQAPNKRPRSRASQFQGSIYYDLEPDQNQNEIYASRSMMHFPPAQFCVPMTPMGHYAPHNTAGRSFYS